MARRNRFSKPVIAVLGSALLLGAVVVVYKLLGSGSKADPIAVNDPAPVKVTPEKNTPLIPDTKLAAIKVEAPATQPIRTSLPTTKPVADPVIQHVPTPPAISNTPPNQLVEEAAAKQKADDLIGARKALVQALDSKKLNAADTDDAMRRLSEINEVVVFSNRKFLSDEYAVSHVVKPGELMQKIAASYDVTWKFVGRLNNISDPRKLQSGKSLKIVKGPFHALVNKTHFTIDLYIGKPTEPGAIFVKRLRCGLGENDSTPTGTWMVDGKLENPRYYNPRADGPRVIEPDDPKNPLGERWIALVGTSGQALGKTSYGIHGTIDPQSIGQKKSMGCIRMLNEDVELVYDMLIPGKSTVTVVE